MRTSFRENNVNGTSKKHTGYPSIDKPWLDFYSDEAKNTNLPEYTLYEYLYTNNKEHPNDIALVYYGNRITYGELFKNIDKASCTFSALGVKQGDIVIVAAVTIPETIYTFYALNRLGAIPNMVDPRTSVEGIHDYIKETNSKYVLSIDAAYEKIEKAIVGTGVLSVIVISPKNSLPIIKKVAYHIETASKKSFTNKSTNCIQWKNFIKKGEGNIPKYSPYVKNACCVIVHTGGTTGMPKGVMLSNENVNSAVLQAINSGLNLNTNHKWLEIMPPFIAYGIINGVHLPLVKGMQLILIPSFDPNTYDELLLKYRPNHIAGVPSHYSKLMFSEKLRKKDLSFIDSPIIGGDAVEKHMEAEISKFLQDHNCKNGLIKGYGMTEVCAAVTTTAHRDSNKPGSVGIPFTHTVISIFDEDGNELKYGETGEVCILSSTTMMGYYANKLETENILRRYDDGNIWVHSGDLGYMDEDGCLFIVGRKKRLIIRHDGFKIFPTLIENTVSACSAVSSCCAVGIRDMSHSQGKLPIVYVVIKKEYSDKREKVKKGLFALCEKELPEYEQPVDFIFKEELPVTPIGKINFRELEIEADSNKYGMNNMI